MIVLAQVTGGTGKRGFCAGLVLVDDYVTEAAPILHYMRGWSRDHVREYCARRLWQVRVVSLPSS